MTETTTTLASQKAILSRQVSDSLRPQMLAGFGSALVLFGGLGGWAATTDIAGSVMAAGTVVVESNLKKVQHPTGGVVGEVLVKEGNQVEAGALLVRLDQTVTKANLFIVTRQLDEIAIRSARLMAERDGGQAFDLPSALAQRASEPEIESILAGERSLFDSRRTAINGQKAQLAERVVQLTHEMAGLSAQSAAKVKEIDLIAKELEGLSILNTKNLVSVTKFTATQREAARLDGERAQLYAAYAQAKGKIAEIELQSIQLEQDMRRDSIKELREIQAKQAELDERRIAAEDQLKRIDIRAPHAGLVHQSTVHTAGQVINAGEAIMMIVPQGEALVIEAKIAPQDIDHVHTGQTAFVRFTAFNQRTTPEFVGDVSLIAADLTKEQQTGASWFVARISLPLSEIARLGVLKLKPGMPAEVHIQTGDRTALSYLMKPLADQFARAFKER